jgi:hypothetical protein
MLIPTSNLMKKSSTVDNSPIFSQPNTQLLTRYTFNCNNELSIPAHSDLAIPEESRGYEEERRV